MLVWNFEFILSRITRMNELIHTLVGSWSITVQTLTVNAFAQENKIK